MDTNFNKKKIVCKAVPIMNKLIYITFGRMLLTYQLSRFLHNEGKINNLIVRKKRKAALSIFLYNTALEIIYLFGKYFYYFTIFYESREGSALSRMIALPPLSRMQLSGAIELLHTRVCLY